MYLQQNTLTSGITITRECWKCVSSVKPFSWNLTHTDYSDFRINQIYILIEVPKWKDFRGEEETGGTEALLKLRVVSNELVSIKSPSQAVFNTTDITQIIFHSWKQVISISFPTKAKIKSMFDISKKHTDKLSGCLLSLIKSLLAKGTGKV